MVSCVSPLGSRGPGEPCVRPHTSHSFEIERRERTRESEWAEVAATSGNSSRAFSHAGGVTPYLGEARWVRWHSGPGECGNRRRHLEPCVGGMARSHVEPFCGANGRRQVEPLCGGKRRCQVEPLCGEDARHQVEPCCGVMRRRQIEPVVIVARAEGRRPHSEVWAQHVLYSAAELAVAPEPAQLVWSGVFSMIARAR